MFEYQKQKMVEVSVLMTSYNAEQFIEHAIQSVLSSSFRNFELIIVDDCSTDYTATVCQKFADQDQRIRFFRNTENKGDYKNRNIAASLARGKYIKYLDADDIMYSHCLHVMIEAMTLFPEAAYAFCSRELQNDCKTFPYQMSPRESFEEHYRRGLFYNGPGSSIIRTDIFRECGGFPETRHISDTEFWMTVAMKYPIAVMSGSLIWWRKHDKQESKIESNNTSVGFQRLQLNKKILVCADNPVSCKMRTAALLKLKKGAMIKMVNSFFRVKSLSDLIVSCKLAWTIIRITTTEIQIYFGSNGKQLKFSRVNA